LGKQEESVNAYELITKVLGEKFLVRTSSTELMGKKWSAMTWFAVIGPLAAFLLLTLWVADILEHVPGWQPVPYIAVPIAVAFLIIGAAFRYKWGRFIFG
jgi:protein-S-isoprenylcysteine O-methyltransferase Ste14